MTQTVVDSQIVEVEKVYSTTVHLTNGELDVCLDKARWVEMGQPILVRVVLTEEKVVKR